MPRKPNKQHDVKGASLARIALDVKKLIIVTPNNLAKVFMKEARKVRGLR